MTLTSYADISFSFSFSFLHFYFLSFFFVFSFLTNLRIFMRINVSVYVNEAINCQFKSQSFRTNNKWYRNMWEIFFLSYFSCRKYQEIDMIRTTTTRLRTENGRGTSSNDAKHREYLLLSLGRPLECR